MTKRLDDGRSWLRVGAMALAGLMLASFLTLAPDLAPETRAVGRFWSSTTVTPVLFCVKDATPQICDPAHLHMIAVPRGKKIRVTRLRYTAANTHCSDARLIYSLNGRVLGKTDWVAAGQNTTVEVLAVTLRRRKGGTPHRFAYRAQGRPGGCNGGLVGTWAGEIRLSGSKSNL